MLGGEEPSSWRVSAPFQAAVWYTAFGEQPHRLAIANGRFRNALLSFAAVI